MSSLVVQTMGSLTVIREAAHALLSLREIQNRSFQSRQAVRVHCTLRSAGIYPLPMRLFVFGRNSISPASRFQRNTGSDYHLFIVIVSTGRYPRAGRSPGTEKRFWQTSSVQLISEFGRSDGSILTEVPEHATY